MDSFSPYGNSTPGRSQYYDREREHFASPSPTPSPRGAYYYQHTPQRPQTRAHFRNVSTGGFGEFSPSPRYTSDGQYATVNVSSSRSARKQSFSSPRTKRERRSSYSYYRTSDLHGDSDEDEFIEINGVTYVLPARSRSKRDRDSYYVYPCGHGTNNYSYTQTGYPSFDREAGYPTPRREAEAQPPRRSHARRSSTSIPQRPATVRPGSSHKKQQPAAAAAAAGASTPRKATEADAKKHRIPAGYSLKNWDPAEEPITLLGSVFDANSLGKWIYDWTVYRHGPTSPIAGVAGDLWLLLIQLAGKIKRSDESVPKIRSKDNKEMVEDFIESGERLQEKLRKLLKLCEAPMLKSAKKRESSQLGNNAGVEFVDTLFGREREMEKTERFMQSVRLWNLRFDANCEEILESPHI